MDDLSQFNELFFQSTHDHTAAIKKLLEDIVEPDSLNLEELHLHFHSLKGEVLAMQYVQFGALITVLEKYVKSVKEVNGTIANENIQMINGAVKDINEILDIIKSENTEPKGISDKTEMLKKYLGVAL